MIHVLLEFYHWSLNYFYSFFHIVIAELCYHSIVFFQMGKRLDVIRDILSRSKRSFWKRDALSEKKWDAFQDHDETRWRDKRGNCTCMNGTWLFDSIFSSLSFRIQNYVYYRSCFTPLPRIYNAPFLNSRHAHSNSTTISRRTQSCSFNHRHINEIHIGWQRRDLNWIRCAD